MSIPEKIKLDIWEYIVNHIGLEYAMIVLAVIVLVTIGIVLYVKRKSSETLVQKAGNNASQIQIGNFTINGTKSGK
jgi:ABC-type proline/glycine betaine transport system permease subunit